MNERSLRSYILHCALLAIAYYVAAKMGLALTIEPERASPIFPATGVALAGILIGGYRLWPGIILGGLLLNIPNFQLWLDQPSASSIAIIITLASTAQALVGAFLIRRFKAWPGLLEKAKDILLFAILGGPVACLIASSAGVLAILNFDPDATSSYAFKWLCWWVGDTIGVLLFAPPILLWLHPSARTVQKRKWPATIAFLIAIAVIGGFFIALNNQSKQALRQGFDENARDWYHIIGTDVNTLRKHLLAIDAFFASSDYISRSEFKTFVSNSISAQPGLIAIEWVERVPHDQIAAFETNVRKSGVPDFSIYPIQQPLIQRVKDSDHFPILYVEPMEENKQVLGADFGSEFVRHTALMKARDSGQLVISDRVSPIQAPEASGILMFQPVYENNKPIYTLEQRRQNFKGVILAVLDIKQFVESAFAHNNQNGMIKLRIEDMSAGNELRELYGKDNSRNSLFQWSKILLVADREWNLTFYSAYAALTADLIDYLGFILFGGLCLTFVIAVLLLVTSGRVEAVHRLVAEKTSEIEAREEIFRSAMNNASIGMALISPEGKWLKVNKSLCELLGYGTNELLVKNFQSISHAEDLDKNQEYIRQMLAGEISSYSMEKRFLHKNGGIVWTLLNATLVSDAGGKPQYFIAQIQDIGARREMDRLKNEFISTVSHELRTPLTSIRGALGLIAGGVLGKIPEKAADFIRIAHKNSERLILIINDILDIEKVEAGKMAMHPKPVDVDQILQQAIEANQMYGDKYKIKYLLKQVPQDTQVLADPDRLMQILANLLSNAAKFSPPNSEVWVGAEIKGDHVVFSIRDFGNGIPEEFRPRMFEKFARADNSDARKTEGTGLGLRITAKLIETMRGKIDFETETGKGTCFYFTLPKVHTSIVVAIEPAENTSSYPILICEDDKTMSGLIKAYLERAGFRTETAYTISEARQKLQSKTYAAVTMDIMLPDGSGVEFVEELRTRPETHDLPVVIVSGKASESKQTIQGNRIGVVDWLDKPSETARLDSRLIHSLKRAVSGDIERLPHVLHIEDDNDLSHILNRAMMDHAIVVNAPTLRSAEKWLEHTYFDLIILDVELPDGSGLDFLANLKEIAGDNVPVIILSASEVDAEVQKQVAASLVKSRVSETYIIDRILAVIDHSSAHKKRKGALS